MGRGRLGENRLMKIGRLFGTEQDQGCRFHLGRSLDPRRHRMKMGQHKSQRHATVNGERHDQHQGESEAH
jgi:hypothetical protein